MANTIIFLLLNLVLCPVATSFNNHTDLLSLLSFKSVLQDPLGSLNSWNETTHFCNWTGIRCSRRHPSRVGSISLRSRGLVGSLSPHIGNLSFLRLITLQNNTFQGLIPQEISLLWRLEIVDLSNNSFIGAIPANFSTRLVALNLIDNKLSGPIPCELGFMFKLDTLALGRNNLSGPIPQSIGNLTSLKILSLAYSGLKGEIPASIARLEKLEFLQLSVNSLTGTIPPALFNLSRIQYFHVSNNQLEGVLPSTLGLSLPKCVVFVLALNRIHGSIPASLSNASLLEHLELYENYFTGNLPTTLGKLVYLRSFIFTSNQIEGNIDFISSFNNCSYLRILQADNNLLTGSLPDSIGNLSTQLFLLSLGVNKVHGKIPSAIGNLVELSIIDLSHNYLEGPLPVTMAKISNLQYFAGTRNRFADELPSFFGNLTSLLYLYLGGNKFSGNLPSSIGNCTNLLEFDVSSNNFKGLIPPEIMRISSLSIWLGLSDNLFEGTIPNEVGFLTNLEGLDLSYNRLSGPIPDSLSQCSSLEVLDMTSNLLEGEIPSALSALTGLQNLSLSQNNLSGSIPAFLGKLNLQYLNLSFNRLQGEVPTIGIFKYKTSVSLDGNKELCGGILELRLKPCPQPHSKKKSLSSLLKIIIPILVTGGIFVTILAAFIYKQRMCLKNVTPPLSSFTGAQIMRLSYADLLNATGGFSETNMLGFGKFGSVYKGVLDDGNTEIAVKVLNLSVRGASRSFEAECSTLRNANLMQRLNIAVDIAKGVEYLHSGTDLCIVHGDLKPSNILLDDDMTAYVGDFGLSKFVSDTYNDHNSSIGIRGTIGYVPPEYGMSYPVSMQGDAYSYGIVLLEMFTNKRPTDDLLEDHVNLHEFVSAALPHRVMEVVAPQFQTQKTKDMIKDCLTSVLTIGVSCSKEMPRERMSMADVVNELHKIQKLLSRIN